MKNGLTLDRVSKAYADQSLVMNHISLTLKKGETLSLLGPSGSGKTTLLRLIAGLESLDRGSILFDGQRIDTIPAHRRQFGMMFQDFALFPHMNVYDNIAFGLKMKGLNKAAVALRVGEMLSLTGLDGFEKRGIDDLSGGERQRVALARTLAPNPRLLMLDEPLSSLDRGLRKRLLTELTDIIKQLGLTTVFVTHDHEEAFIAGHQIVVMNRGEIVQQGTRQDLIENPVNEWVYDFFKH